MKSNVKLIISVLFILVLSAYLLLSGRHGKSELKLEAWDKEPDYILIQKSSELLYFRKDNGAWYINDAKYPADTEAVTNFTDKIKNLVITDLISEQPYYDRYGLTPEKEMTVIVKAGDEILRRISAGNQGVTGRRTFLKVDGRPEVYQGNAVFSDGDMSIEAYRDMKICKIPAADISDLTVAFKGKSFNFHKEPPLQDGGKEAGESGETSESDAVWSSPQAEGNKLDTRKVGSFVTSVANLRASGFAEAALIRQSDKKALVVVKSGEDTEISFDIFLYDEKEKSYAVVLSDSKYPFTVEEWAIKKFFLDDISQYFVSEK